MNRRGTVRFILVIGVGWLIVISLMQLLGTVWFHKATDVGDGEIPDVGAMQKACAFQPSHSFYRFCIGEVLWEQSKARELAPIERRTILERAKIHLEKAVFLEPAAGLYHRRLGWVCAVLGLHDPAMKKRADRAFTRAIVLNPTNFDFRWDVANYYLDQYALSPDRGGRDQAKTDVGLVRASFLRHFRAFLDMQSPHALKPVLDRCFEVTSDYEDLRQLIPDRPGYHLGLARFLDQKEIWDAAQKEFETAISQDPTNPEAYHAYGRALFAHERHEEAVAMWEREQTLTRESPRSYLTRAHAFWALDRKGDAVKELQRLVAIHPEEIAYRLLLARRFEGIDLPKKALRTYREALERDSKNERIYVQLAGYWIRQGNVSEAEAALVQAISLKPEEVAYRHQLAQLFFNQKRYARAIDEWQEILSDNPDSVGALIGIARSYERLEIWNRALRTYKDALTLKPTDPSIRQKIEAIEKERLAD